MNNYFQELHEMKKIKQKLTSENEKLQVFKKINK